MPIAGMEMEADHVLPYTRLDLEKSKKSINQKHISSVAIEMFYIDRFYAFDFSRYA